MKSKNTILILIVTILVVIVFYSFNGSQDDTTYGFTVLEAREDTDRFMRTSKESPFASNPESFLGLDYYDPDPKYRIIADFVPPEKKRIVILPTSDGKEVQYAEYGYAEFQLDGSRHRLLIYQAVGIGQVRGKLFVPFGDETSAVETYGGGRYLDVNHTPGATTITIDFNRAYNPYCAYNDSYSCPLPPAGNLLKVAIRAGEKDYPRQY